MVMAHCHCKCVNRLEVYLLRMKRVMMTKNVKMLDWIQKCTTLANNHSRLAGTSDGNGSSSLQACESIGSMIVENETGDDDKECRIAGLDSKMYNTGPQPLQW